MRNVILIVVAVAGCGKALDDYAKKAKTSEAKVQLAKLQSRAKATFMEKGSFPQASIALTPATSCCAQQTKKCKASAQGQWDAWRALDFQLDDDFYFQYSYESDGKTLTARAVGDPSCEGSPVTFVLTGRVNAGNPEFTVEEP